MTLRYKGYIANLEADPRANLLHGEVAGIRDVVTFHGRTPAEAEQAFRDSVDDYLAFCASRGESPNRPFSGKLMVRLNAALHQQMSALAEAAGVSLNNWISQHLAGSVRDELKDEGSVVSGTGDNARRPGLRRVRRRAGKGKVVAKSGVSESR